MSWLLDEQLVLLVLLLALLIGDTPLLCRALPQAFGISCHAGVLSLLVYLCIVYSSVLRPLIRQCE